jgi:hypothetical protein
MSYYMITKECRFSRGDIERVFNFRPQNDSGRIAKLWFVHDEGVYIMRHGGKGVPLAFAEGCDPNKGDVYEVYDQCERLVGGDDFAIKLPIQLFREFLRSGAPEFIAQMEEDGVFCTWEEL